MRSRALVTVFIVQGRGLDASALDVHNARLLQRLCASPQLALDTVQLHQQPAGHHIYGYAYWSTELWDVRSLCREGTPLRAAMLPFGAYRALANTSNLYGWANGSACAPSPEREWRNCLACDGSQLQCACKRQCVLT